MLSAVTDSECPVAAATSGELELSAYCKLGKRTLDLAVSAVALIALSPVLLAVAIASRISMGKGVLFTQKRVGLHGAEFTCLKFRTMDNDRRLSITGFNGDDRRESHKSPNDPRHTKVGRFLRKYSLDELPQLINVLKGEMSLIGPRPEMVSVASPDFVSHVRHSVRPGLTGPYQVSSLRLDGDLRLGLNLDADYVHNLSLTNDLTLVWRTFGVILSGSGE